ncbi:unnamed protein product [Ceratitis capitata]|uniref:(Mediterranean fruit fly) hypothetical protein n=1 Tax=Ceratitis capitata TaxID=7213 RepID=A0A811V118_CERCA|nr:unnamed protein product [Ceratitis capitata]
MNLPKLHSQRTTLLCGVCKFILIAFLAEEIEKIIHFDCKRILLVVVVAYVVAATLREAKIRANNNSKAKMAFSTSHSGVLEVCITFKLPKKGILIGEDIIMDLTPRPKESKNLREPVSRAKERKIVAHMMRS